ncbi:MAG: UvrD-helicase domain-containing protein [Candidatus Roizmanbacteria bacterium]|nr:UvrD-helicase domain-containing protein [Candidatus Roizmanbacteria bacterium]
MHEPSIQLNSSQQKAIKSVSGPLLIVAGAGTGKTTTLVEKIKYLINQKLARPEEILCLTFTEKAAYEMEERVDRAMPYGFFQMWISTFHAFADDILRDELHHLGMNASYTLMSQAQSVLFLRNNLFNLNLKYFRPVSNPNKFIEGLLQHFSRLQDEDISPEEYQKWVTQHYNTQPSHPELDSGSRIPKTGSQVKPGMTSIVGEEIDQYAELSYAYKTYQKIKIEHDVMDFGDLIFYLNNLFRKRPSILKQYQQKFKYILVDEFQDTNIAQYELIKLLCPPKNNPNLTVVGDDSQAIYKFRGASISNILTFMDDYKKARQITLNDNYRSNQTVLDLAYNLVQNNNPDTLESKLGISKELKSHTKNIKDAVTFNLFAHGDQEADWIVNKIATLHTKEYSFRDFAILVRANSHSEPIITALKRKGIPFQFLGPGTLFKQAEVKDIIAYLQILADPNNTVSMFRVLSMELFQIDAEDLVMCMSFAKKTSLSLYQAIEIFLSFEVSEWYKKDSNQYKEHLPLIKEGTKDKLIEIVTMIKKHLGQIRNDSAGEILFSFLEDSGLLKRLSNPTSEIEEKRTLNITKFFQKLKDIERAQEDTSVFSVNDFITMSMELGESPLAGETDIAEVNAVNILTVHSSKGLEFPVVFLPNVSQGRFPTYRRREQIPIPESLIKEQIPAGDYHAQEERRLFYVGLTRAKDRSFITASEIYGEGLRKRKISPFVAETIGLEEVQKSGAFVAEKKEQLSIFDFKKQGEPVILPPTEVKNISYSQLQTYEMCPLQYKYQYILKIPTAPGSAASFGSTIHNVLQKFYKGFATDSTWDLPHLLNILETMWIPIGYSSQAHQKRMKEEAKEMLENYYHSFHTPEIKIIDLEKLFKIRIGSSEFLTGKIDRVDQKKNGGIEVVDYKTGRRPDDKKLKKDLQLAIYAKAASDPGLYNIPIEKIDLSFYYLQAREKITLNRTTEDLEEVQTRVKDVVQKIRGQQFEPHVGLWCDYCSFRMICEAWK